MTRKPKVSRARPAGPDHQVLTIVGGQHQYRKSPCDTCPWRLDAVGEFPAEAFRHSAHTAHDMAQEEFACHASGATKPATCAGYLLRGAHHNLAHRMHVLNGLVDPNLLDDGGYQLFENYRAMAIANGVSPDDPILAKCRD